MVSCWLWKAIANNLSLSLAGRWIGFAGIFINFECSKQAFYYPVLTDVTALFISILLLYFYLEKRPLAIFCTTIIGAFSWPVVSISGALLLIYMQSKLSDQSINPPAQGALVKKFTPRLIGMIIFLGALGIFGYIFLLFTSPPSEEDCRSFSTEFSSFVGNLPIGISNHLGWMANDNYTCVLEKLLIKSSQLLTSFISIFILLLVLGILIGSRSFIKESILNLLKVRPLLLILAIAAILIPAFIVALISNQNIPNEGNLGKLIKIIFFPPEGKILLPIVTLTSFWGPIILILIFNWREFSTKARQLGSGPVGIIAISMILGLANEPRFLTIGWPFMVLGAVLMLEGLKLSKSFKYLLLALTILYAQFWIRLNYTPWLPPDSEGLLDYPKQLFFMHYGVWMAWDSYFIQLIIFAITGIFLKNLLDKGQLK
jgi:hypothetical protein